MIIGKGVQQFPSRRSACLPIMVPPLLPPTGPPSEIVAPRPVCGADESTNVLRLTSRHPGPWHLVACHASPIIALWGEHARFTADARHCQTNSNCCAAESNWQFVIFIASTPLHPKRGIISCGDPRGKSIQRDCSTSVPFPSVSCRFPLTLSSRFLKLTPFFFFFYTSDVVSSCCPPSGCLDLTLLDAVTSYLAYFPLCGERSHLSKNGLRPLIMADWRLPLFIGAQPSLSSLLLP